ncbi:MAG: hypothetical protein QG654_431 [Patescibacteria group bacterium]|jgi:hypothetical protein|nr:hypothetical protein [Patescibacteria group bacterium]
MNTKYISKALIVILVLIIGFFTIRFLDQKRSAEIRENENTGIVDSNPKSLKWKFEDSDSLNLDGLPNTDVFVEVSYESGETRTLLVDTQSGGCNALDISDKDNALGSKNAQCYGAGLGFTYKITKGEDSYLVKRKQFEEALPGYNPPVTEYEVVLEIPFK